MILRGYLDAVHSDHVRLGFRSGNCDRCTPSAWHDDARAHRLRPAVVGGIPIDHPDSPLGARHVEGTPAPACRAPSEAPDMATQPAA